MHEGHIFHSHHHHDGSSAATAQPNEAAAMLSYMLEHNRHHAEELHELAHGLEGDAAQLLHEGVHYFEHGNECLEAALKKIKGE